MRTLFGAGIPRAAADLHFLFPSRRGHLDPVAHEVLEHELRRPAMPCGEFAEHAQVPIIDLDRDWIAAAFSGGSCFPPGAFSSVHHRSLVIPSSL